MTRRRPKNVLRRFGLILVGLQVATVAFLALYAGAEAGKLHRGLTREMLERLVDLHEETLRAIPFEDMNARIIRDGARTGVRLTVLSDDGSVLLDSQVAPAGAASHADQEEVASARRRGTGMSVRFSETQQREMMFVARRVERTDGPPIIVRAAFPMERLRTAIARPAILIGVAGATLIVLSIGFLVAISRVLHRAVCDLTEEASRFARGELEPIDVPAEEELQQLTATMNDMASTLRTRMAQLRAQQKDLNAILQAMTSGVLALDRARRIMNLNHAAEMLLGVTAETACGRMLHECVRQADLNQFVDGALDSNPRGSIELDLGGEPPRRVQVVSTPLAGDDGAPAGILIMFNDVTHLRRLESLRSDFAANVSHELRTPITNVKGYVDTLVSVGVDDREQTRRFLEIIRKNTDRLAAIVEDIMELTRLEQPRGLASATDREATEMTRFVRETVGQLEAAAARNRTTIECDAPEPLMAEVHRSLLERALVNLVDNAIRYSPRDTTVTVSVRRDGPSRMVIAVEDRGPGIPAKHLPRLFERFYRVDKARSRELGGTGLGLAIVKHVALVHGGRVDVESVVGRGSRFFLTLPTNLNPATPDRRPAQLITEINP